MSARKNLRMGCEILSYFFLFISIMSLNQKLIPSTIFFLILSSVLIGVMIFLPKADDELKEEQLTKHLRVTYKSLSLWCKFGIAGGIIYWATLLLSMAINALS